MFEILPSCSAEDRGDKEDDSEGFDCTPLQSRDISGHPEATSFTISKFESSREENKKKLNDKICSSKLACDKALTGNYARSKEGQHQCIEDARKEN